MGTSALHSLEKMVYVSLLRLHDCFERCLILVEVVPIVLCFVYATSEHIVSFLKDRSDYSSVWEWNEVDRFRGICNNFISSVEKLLIKSESRSETTICADSVTC